MLFSVLLFQNTWLEMRVNLGHVFFAMLLILFLVQTLIKPVRKFCRRFMFSLCCLIISSAGLYFTLGPEGLRIIPASIIREGIMQPRITFSVINTALTAIALTGIVIVFLADKNER